MILFFMLSRGIIWYYFSYSVEIVIWFPEAKKRDVARINLYLTIMSQIIFLVHVTTC